MGVLCNRLRRVDYLVRKQNGNDTQNFANMIAPLYEIILQVQNCLVSILAHDENSNNNLTNN